MSARACSGCGTTQSRLVAFLMSNWCLECLRRATGDGVPSQAACVSCGVADSPDAVQLGNEALCPECRRLVAGFFAAPDLALAPITVEHVRARVARLSRLLPELIANRRTRPRPYLGLGPLANARQVLERLAQTLAVPNAEVEQALELVQLIEGTLMLERTLLDFELGPTEPTTPAGTRRLRRVPPTVRRSVTSVPSILELLGRITDVEALRALGIERLAELPAFIEGAAQGLNLGSTYDTRYRHFRDWLQPRLTDPSLPWTAQLFAAGEQDEAKAIAVLQELLTEFLKAEADDALRPKLP